MPRTKFSLDFCSLLYTLYIGRPLYEIAAYYAYCFDRATGEVLCHGLRHAERERIEESQLLETPSSNCYVAHYVEVDARESPEVL
jgi:hypothetical protein